MRPMTSDSVDIYYFSGTGNTLLVVKKMKEVFERNGLRVGLFRMEKTNPANVDLSHTVGLGFPVAAQGTFPFVWDFVRSLPQADGTPVFMVDTLAIYSGGVVGPMRKLLEEKGYTPIGAKEIRMPSNLFPKEVVPEKVEDKVRKGLEKAERYANDLLAGRTRWGRVPILSDMVAIFSQKGKAWKLFRKIYRLQVDTSKCRRCGLCVRLCPVGNITMNEFPEFRGECQFCMRCISFCPTGAIHLPGKEYEVYRAVKVGELLKE